MLKDIRDCKVVVGENVARQHRTVVCSVTLVVRTMTRTKTEHRTNWWKLKLERVLCGFQA